MQKQKQLIELKTPLKDGWTFQIIMGRKIKTSSSDTFEELEDQSIDSDTFFDIHRGVHAFWKATGSLPEKGDIISDPLDNSTVYERWIWLKDQTVVFFLSI
ncbi:hypothetical protein [Flavilitoribacter nigricans]|uniref:Uncharacterized protein n=1 Tax=Flavilitoribacter nigricans (strain ATCC 23147 / DSM 23189 / NBRC 102662 / NCIMB 1420 / SS-2) TaxID=1122177 RepID=A0A2D0N077_FLAN2|nr:hypothetical protein [Flavilitoribacter nigricans]PHN01885.1 hypothetical protein CRP01_35200 [Flavilitoribacter nigricans DSM 23189 = NBRC 102662]